MSEAVMCGVFVGHNHLGPFLRAAALQQLLHQTASTPTPRSAMSARDKTRVTELAVKWAWPEDRANPLSHLTLLTSLDLSSNALSHLGCDVLASQRSLSELVVADNLVRSLDDLSLQCAGPRLTRLDVSTNRLTQLIVQSLSSRSVCSPCPLRLVTSAEPGSHCPVYLACKSSTPGPTLYCVHSDWSPSVPTQSFTSADPSSHCPVCLACKSSTPGPTL